MEFSLFFLLLSCFFFSTDAAVFSLVNKCSDTVWPGIQPGAGKPQLMNGGFQLKPGETVTINAPTGWSGRFWGRHGCSFDASGKGTCDTGDCGGVLECDGAGGTPPATLAEFTLDSPKDFYDVSLVDGYNMEISISPSGGSGSCRTVKCLSDLNQRCPSGLEVKKKGVTIACKSACLAFDTPQYCCTGAYGSPQTCKPTGYSKAFKSACPMAYSYAYDDPTSIFTCQNANYSIVFC
ncbi:thaumatin-like protein [Cucurbita moschata]|uniref:Thaumatin-like protein n=1 Tax=Cucurbita moschata TaxID=3662 RepID=A0A6J1H5N8_CUCMO|nr:thaumatin-like protein [Cucurbita moschata]